VSRTKMGAAGVVAKAEVLVVGEAVMRVDVWVVLVCNVLVEVLADVVVACIVVVACVVVAVVAGVVAGVVVEKELVAKGTVVDVVVLVAVVLAVVVVVAVRGDHMQKQSKTPITLEPRDLGACKPA
jgi:hypothetical protein